MKIAVSILSSIYDEEETIEKINETDAEYIHVDVMDGQFVINKTNFEHLDKSRKLMDVHLMVSRPFEYISKYVTLKNTESIVIHVELEDNLEELLNYIKSRGVKCGLAINPYTPLEALQPYYELVDEILLMSVVAGKGGQKMLEGTEERLEKLVQIRESGNYKYRIVVDGGVNDETIDKVNLSDIAVAGSFICKSEDYQSQIDKLRLSKESKKC